MLPGGSPIGGILAEVQKAVSASLASQQTVPGQPNMRTGRVNPDVQPIDVNAPLVPIPQNAVSNAISPPGAQPVAPPQPYSMRTGRPMPEVQPPTGVAALGEGLAQGASNVTSPAGFAQAAPFAIPGVGAALGPIMGALMAKQAIDEHGELIGEGASPEQHLEAAGRTLGSFAPFIPGMLKGHGEAPRVGISVESIDTPGAVGLGIEHVRNEEVGKVADEHNKLMGLPKTRDVKPVAINETRARAIARAFDAMPKQDPRAKPAYDQMAREVESQWNAAKKAGYTLEPWKGEGQPYANSAEMQADVRDNKHLFFFQGGEPHPFLGKTDPETGLSVNDKFRAVHDLFGHAKNGLQFGPKGEEAAWNSHVQMFSPLAAKAMTAETRGQNSWVNFGDHNYDEAGQHTNRPQTERPYSDQKATLLPDEFNPPNESGVRTVVKLKDGRILRSELFPHDKSRQLESHLSVLERNGIDPSEVESTGFEIDGQYDDGGGGSVGRGVQVGAPDNPDYVPYAKRPKVGLGIEDVKAGDEIEILAFGRKITGTVIGRVGDRRLRVSYQSPGGKEMVGTYLTVDAPEKMGSGTALLPKKPSVGLSIDHVEDLFHGSNKKYPLDIFRPNPERGMVYFATSSKGAREGAASGDSGAMGDSNSTAVSVLHNNGLRIFGVGDSAPDTMTIREASEMARTMMENADPAHSGMGNLLDASFAERHPYAMDGDGNGTRVRLEWGSDGGAPFVSDEFGNQLPEDTVVRFRKPLSLPWNTLEYKSAGSGKRTVQNALRELGYDAVLVSDEGGHWTERDKLNQGSVAVFPEAMHKLEVSMNSTEPGYGTKFPNRPLREGYDDIARAKDEANTVAFGGREPVRTGATIPKYEAIGSAADYEKATGKDWTTDSPIEKASVLVKPTPEYGEYDAKGNWKPKVGLGIEHVDTPEGEANADRVGRANLARFGLVEDQKKFIRERGSELEKKRTITFDEIRAKVDGMGLTLADTQQARDMMLRNRGMVVAAADVAKTLIGQRETAFKDWQDVQAKGTPREIEIAARKLDKATEAAMTGLKASTDIVSEAGLSLVSAKIAAMRIPAYRYQKALGELLEKMKNKNQGELPADVTTMLRSVDMSDPASIRRFILSQSPKIASWNDKFYEFWVSMLLSNPTTHFRNMLGNTAATIGMPIETLGNAIVGSVVPGKRGTYYGEAPAQLYGMAHGMKGAWEGFKEGMKGTDFEDESKIEHSADPLSRAPKIGGRTGKIVRLPLNALQAADNASKAIVQSASIHQQAYAQAAKEGLHGRALLDRAKEIADLPSEEMLTKAHDEATYRAFQNQLGKWGKKALAFRSTTIGDTTFRPLAYVSPFMTTPVNLLKYGTERTPLQWIAVAKRGVGGDYKGPEGRRQMESDVSKAVLGTVAATMVWNSVLNGNITGSGPTDPAERKAMTDAGWKPYSFRFGKNGKWIPFNNVDPVSTALMLTADTAEIWNAANPEEKKKIITMVGRAYGNNIQDKTFLSGLTGAMDAIDDPDRYLESYLSRQAASMVVPAAVGGVARAMDPYEREAKGLIQTIKSRVPKLREDLMPQRDVRGKPIPARGSGVFEKGGVTDKVFRGASPVLPAADRGGWMERHVAVLGEHVPKLPATLSMEVPGEGKSKTKHDLDLDDGERDVFAQYRGRTLDEAFTSMEKKGSKFRGLSDEEQKDAIGTTVSAAGKIARTQMLLYLSKKGKLPTKYADALAREAATSRRAFVVSIKELE